LVGTPRAWKKEVFPGSIPLHAVSHLYLRCARLFLRVSGGDHDIEGSHGTGTSGSSDTVGEDLVTDLLEIGVGEDEADVACIVVNA
jgi:hypothetical protein